MKNKILKSFLAISLLGMLTSCDTYYEVPSANNTNVIINTINAAQQTSIKANVALYTEESVGSGFVFKAEEKISDEKFIFYILTNYHVISEFVEKKSDFLDLVNYAGYLYEPTILAYDEIKDIALLSVEGEADDFYVVKFSKSIVRNTDLVLSMGNPQGQLNALTIGYVLDSNLTGTVDDILYESLIKHSALVDSGNSGGALLNKDLNVVGINIMAPVENPVFPYQSVNGYALPYKTIELFLTENNYVKLLS